MINYDIRYRRQLIMDRFGEDGQKKLGNAKVLVIGAGGLGSPIISYLSAAGVGKLGIVDHDVIEESNLQRQIIHKTSLLNYPKVKSAERFVNELNPAVETEVFQMKLDKEKAQQLFINYDVIVDAVDNLETRKIINAVCSENAIPFVHGSISNFEGLVTTITPDASHCYNCIFPKSDFVHKGEIGVIGAIPGIIGSIQVLEVIKLIVGLPVLKDEILYYNGLTHDLRKVKINVKSCDCFSKETVKSN